MFLPDLRGKRALISGGTSGIGAALADTLSAAGARVIRHGLPGQATSDGGASPDLARRQGEGPDQESIAVDLSRVGAGHELAEQALAGGPVDIVVHAAAVQVRRHWQEITATEARLQLQVNLLSALELMQSLVPGMRERGWGRIVLVGSVQRRSPDPQMAAYAASKGGLHTLALMLAKDLAPVGVTVNTLAPGVVETPRNAAVLADPIARRALQAAIPAGRIATPADCVAAGLLLCSDEGGYLTGQELVVDGGLTL